MEIKLQNKIKIKISIGRQRALTDNVVLIDAHDVHGLDRVVVLFDLVAALDSHVGVRQVLI